MLFSDLGLIKPILNALDDLNYHQATPIQEQAIPPIIEGKNVMAAAQTGTGKTAGFTLPILHRLSTLESPQQKGNQARVLVLTPTRELAAQVAQSVKDYSQNLKIKSVVVFGGVSINPQMKALRGGSDVLIATPGRLLDLHNQNAVQLDRLEILVLDEADRMLDMGFIHDIRRIIKLIPKKRQTLLFSATFSKSIKELARSIIHKPVEISVAPPNSTVDTVTQRLISVEKSDKTTILQRLINEGDWFQVLVFSRTKHGANRLAGKLAKRGIEASAIHGNKSQGARTKALADFKAGKVRVLVATDIAARGIDINELPHVVNFDLPQVAEDYVHRIGRTGRAGANGEAISLVAHDEFKQLTEIERLIGKHITRVVLDDYEPLNNLPDSKPIGGHANNSSNRSRSKKKKPRNQSSHEGTGSRSKPKLRRNSKKRHRANTESRRHKNKTNTAAKRPKQPNSKSD